MCLIKLLTYAMGHIDMWHTDFLLNIVNFFMTIYMYFSGLLSSV